ncbi:TPA: hypothetical protein ACVU4T_003353, partial [Vibrio parahaemolyticus]
TVEWSKDPATTDAFDLVDNDLDGHVDTLKAVKAGSGSVKATSSGISGTSGLITVDNATITDMAISPDIETLPVGFSQTFEAFAVADTGANAKLNEDQVSWTVTSDVGVSGTDNGDGTYTVESEGTGVDVTVTASLNAGAFPDVANDKPITAEETFTTVPADITNLVVEPLDGSTVVVGVPYRLRAEAVQANGELFDATNRVTWGDWSTDDYDIELTPSREELTITFKADASESVTLTATPNDDSFGEYATPATSTVTVLKPEVKGIIVTPPEKTIGTEESTELKAYAYYSYGKEPLDVTESVTWSVEPAEGEGDTYGVTVEVGSGVATVTSSTQVGVVKVTATDGAGNSNSSVVTVFVLKVCGSGATDLDNIDDTDQANAKGACLKVASDSAGNWFTSTPSIAVMESLGYTLNNFSSNSGDTYTNTYTETGSYGPIDGVFATFRQDGNGVIDPGEGDDANAGVDGQFDRWCQKLTSLNFAGKNDWHRPTKDELAGLYSDVGDSLWDARGWPTSDNYWSATVTGSEYYLVSFDDGDVYDIAPTVGEGSASCVSNP